MFDEEKWVDRCESCKYDTVKNSEYCRGCKYFYRSRFEPVDNNFETIISMICPYCGQEAKQHRTLDGFVVNECMHCRTVQTTIRRV